MPVAVDGKDDIVGPDAEADLLARSGVGHRLKRPPSGIHRCMPILVCRHGPIEDVLDTDKRCDITAPGCVQDDAGLPFVHEVSVDDHRHPGREEVRLPAGVAHLDDREPVLPVEPAEIADEPLLRDGVEGRERFVEEEDVGFHRDGPGKRHPLLLAAREGSRVAVGEVSDTEPLEEGNNLIPCLFLSHPLHPEAVGDVVDDPHVREERVVLVDEGDPSFLRGEGGDLFVPEEHPAALRPVEAGYRLEEHRLSRSRRPDDEVVIAPADRQADLL
ncbi:MAG: hypothetical protein BWX50_01159 [Euryarchaeota archaeon ADurb.Bin009]|nr:MAG: hypothetical protein BWX50_01159 [Euryarchaeota archaeon ADurb.Bin009]